MPSISILPKVGLIFPDSSFKIVDFPEPDKPTIAYFLFFSKH